MTVCPKCNGRGTVGYFHIDHFVDIECDRCHGSGEVPMTNEDWFCQLTTEEKAKFLRQIYRDGIDDYVGEWYEQTEADFVEWLKQPHHSKE